MWKTYRKYLPSKMEMTAHSMFQWFVALVGVSIVLVLAQAVIQVVLGLAAAGAMICLCASIVLGLNSLRKGK